MVRIKVISRDSVKFTRETPLDIQRVSRNIDPELHPFEKPREYTRALNAVKLQRVFAKPFVGDLTGHIDGCYCLLRHPKQINTLASGSCDGGFCISMKTS
jgi:WD repeat and SOF domain-containing protein 1